MPRTWRDAPGCPAPGEWHLVRARCPFDRAAVHLSRSGPPLRRVEHDHRTRGRSIARPVAPRPVWCDLIQRRRPALRPSLDASPRGCLRTLIPDRVRTPQWRPHSSSGIRASTVGLRDLVPVEMQHRQHRPVLRRVEELFPCHPVASAPVSASPSPTTQPRPNPDHRTPLRTHATTNTRVRRPHESIPASPGPRGWECRPETKTAGRADCIPSASRRDRRASARYRSPRARCSPRGPDRRGRAR